MLSSNAMPIIDLILNADPRADPGCTPRHTDVAPAGSVALRRKRVSSASYPRNILALPHQHHPRTEKCTVRNTILTAVLSAVVLVITPAATRAGIIITFSDASNSFKVMTFEMDSVDISTITSASALETVLGTASDYSQITWFFTSAPTPISAGDIAIAAALPVTTFDQTLETFTSVLPPIRFFIGRLVAVLSRSRLLVALHNW